MQKQAPTLGRLLTMVLFALSCFGLLLFLWLSFGGPVPLKPKGYRFKVAFPEATQLALQADVRVAGVSVGKVRATSIDPHHPNRTVATIELTRRFAPISRDARAILRQKTLLGETYVELTPGNPNGPKVAEDGWLADGHVKKTVELDEIFNALDPKTRHAFQTWQQDLAKAGRGRGRDLNDAFGNLPQFAADANDVLGVLDSQSGAVRQLVRNTGTVFGAVTQNESQLRNLITNSEDVFSATARQADALAETLQIFPTFLDESKATFARLQSFSLDARPLMQDLKPVARDLRPTLRATHALAPDLRAFFTNLDPLITAARTGLPAVRDTLGGAKPLLGNLSPFLEQLNPILQWLEYNQWLVADFISNGAGALADTVPSGPNEMGHYLRQFGPAGAESVAFWANRPAGNRGNAYLGPAATTGPKRAREMIFPSWDCANTGKGEFTTDKPDKGGDPSCFVQGHLPGAPGGDGPFPHIGAADYSKGR
jgi:phospholipid/cholesterol/gamma-HCH transport system substrate-binding protein